MKRRNKTDEKLISFSSSYYTVPAKLLFQTLTFILLFYGTLISGSPDSLENTIAGTPPTISSEVSGLAGQTIVLPCHLSQDTCGSIHSIKWYRNDKRVYIFSEIAKISRAEYDLADRATLHLDTNNSLAQLEIKPLMAADEDLYKCEVTYLEAKEHCALLQSIRLSTFAKPEYVRIENMSGSETANASLIGPFNEGSVITLVCISGGGKPVAQLDWFNSSRPIDGHYRNMTEDDGTGIGSSQIQITLSRGDLGAKLECRASSPTLKTPISAWVEVDVYVRPALWELTGYDSPVLAGTLVTLLCRVKGARPAANITFYNGTRILTPQPSSNLAVQSAESETSTEISNYVTEEEIIEADGTYETQSRLIFTASRYDNGIILACQSSNLVMESTGEIPYRSTAKIQVNYPPVVTVSPINSTVNETTDILVYCEVDANPPELISVRWYRNGELLELADISKYEGGTTMEPSLLIRNASKDDLGYYSCVVQNQIGATQSEIFAYINVLYKPHVKLTMNPPTAVREQDQRNVTLSCDLQSGNPDTLLAVRWYLDNDLLKELPECPNSTSSEIYNDLCDIDPSKLMLENVGRSFQGKYTCIGRNEAGWGLPSPATELLIHYPPGPARLEFSPMLAVKGQLLNFSCNVEDLGRPKARVYRWMRGTHVQMDVKSKNWTIFPVSLEHRANFSCEAVNEAGNGPSSHVNIDVFAPPTFIERLPPYLGVLSSAKDVSVTCQIECFPLCEIIWLKNGLPLVDSEYYSIKTNTLPPDQTKSDFESVVSTLIWNLDAWPNKKLDRMSDNANYTCQSTSNSVGGGVSSTTYFRVEYPPERINVSKNVVNVIEGETPDKITCGGKAFPEANYIWKNKDDVLSAGPILFLDYQIQRSQAGEYECIASNRHGNLSAKAQIIVNYAPECTISQKEIDDNYYLICEVDANPTDVSFQWMLDNITYTENVQNNGLTSTITLIPSPEYFGNYRCFANNSIGTSVPCSRAVSGNWIRKLSDHNLVIIASVIGGSIVLFLIICLIIIIVCKRRRTKEKYNNSRLEERQNPEGKDPTVSADGPVGSQQQSHQVSNQTTTKSGTQNQNKWPIKPGVHLHVKDLNGLQSLGKGVQQPINGFSYGTKNTSTILNETKTNEDQTEITQVSRKRKKPGKDPSPARKGELNEENKAYYENLPFHGLQTPQAKLKSTGETAIDRPHSELSQTGSSGYGSTRSQKEQQALQQQQQQQQATTTMLTTKPVNIVKPSTDLEKDLADDKLGPKTSTPIKPIKIPPEKPPKISEIVVKQQQQQKQQQPPVKSVRGTKNKSNLAVATTATAISSPEKPKIIETRDKTKEKVIKNGSIKLATVRPQRISSGGSFRPSMLRMPEAPKILFRSVRNSSSSKKEKSSFETLRSKREDNNNTIIESKDLEITSNKVVQSISNTTTSTGSSIKNTKASSSNSSNNSSFSNDETPANHDDDDGERAPLAAPRSLTLTKSRRHTYQNIPFTRKTQRHETLLTPLSLQYQHQNSHLHHLPHSNHQQLQPAGYATTHRTFPSASASDLIFQSLNRKSSKTNGRSHNGTGLGGGERIDLMDHHVMGSNGGRSLRPTPGHHHNGGPGQWYASQHAMQNQPIADIVQGHYTRMNGGGAGHLNGDLNLNGGSSLRHNGKHHKSSPHFNGFSNGTTPTAPNLQQHYNNHQQQAGGVHPSQFPIRASEINV